MTFIKELRDLMDLLRRSGGHPAEWMAVNGKIETSQLDGRGNVCGLTCFIPDDCTEDALDIAKVEARLACMAVNELSTLLAIAEAAATFKKEWAESPSTTAIGRFLGVVDPAWRNHRPSWDALLRVYDAAESAALVWRNNHLNSDLEDRMSALSDAVDKAKASAV